MTMAAAQLGIFGSADGADGEPREFAAIGRATEWLNSPRLTAASLRGKVVLVDFWTYTCINWLRTLPYVRTWSQKYTQGLIVIGVHTPEFAFEHHVDNVRRAVQQMKVPYPVVIDNDYSIWRAFRNQYWPALYVIDARGRIREHQFGEGEYERSERAIQRLLSEAGPRASATASCPSRAAASKRQPIGRTCDRPKPTFCTTAATASRRMTPPPWIGVARIQLPADWR
jgi:thiol-disulfide isomerase/thioredoxin